MNKDIRITGLRHPRPGRRSHRRRSFTSPIRLRSFMWLLTIGALAFGTYSFGTPHLRFKYTYRVLQPAAPFIEGDRFYIACDYIGWSSQRLRPRDGRCPLIRFLHKPNKS